MFLLFFVKEIPKFKKTFRVRFIISTFETSEKNKLNAKFKI
jgi:hypothetical protein